MGLVQEVQELIQKGVSKRKIARVMKISRHTVSQYHSGDPTVLAESSRVSFAKLEPFQEEIISLINKKIMRKDVYACIAKQG
jgi:predicted transcriptional regulator